MSENTGITAAEILERIDAIIADTAYIQNAMAQCAAIDLMGSAIQIHPIPSIVMARETTNQKLIEFLREMYQDLRKEAGADGGAAERKQLMDMIREIDDDAKKADLIRRLLEREEQPAPHAAFASDIGQKAANFGKQAAEAGRKAADVGRKAAEKTVIVAGGFGKSVAEVVKDAMQQASDAVKAARDSLHDDDEFGEDDEAFDEDIDVEAEDVEVEVEAEVETDETDGEEE
ncbi:MAG: hypothetical protein LBN30_08245 [Oscillospiraceae bacterium]|jgi:hypothetical protein|nr:hypothetical protein [Oscillospiraceae bacterium]